MKRSLLVLGITLVSALPAKADLTHRISSSIQLDVGAASSRAVRLPNTYSVSGSGINTTDGTTAGSIGGLGAPTDGVNAFTAITATQATDGAAFSFSQSYQAGDAIPTAAATVGTIPNFGDVTSTAAGTAGTLAGTITTAGAITITAGGANTSAVASVVSDLTVR